MINPLRACLWGLWLCYSQQTCSYFGNAHLPTVSSPVMCWLSPLGVVKHLWRMAYWSVDLDIPSSVWRQEALLGQIRFAWEDRGRDGNKSPACLDSEHGVELRLASALSSGTCGCCIFVCHQDLDLNNWKRWPIWIKPGKNGAVSGFLKNLKRGLNREAQVINMDTSRNNKNPWVPYETEVPHSRFWWVFFILFLFIWSW